MTKNYYIVRSSHGCLGSSGSVERIAERFSSKQKAQKILGECKRLDKDKNVIYWLDFDWKIS